MPVQNQPAVSSQTPTDEQFTAEDRRIVDEILSAYEGKRSDLIPVLQRVQQTFGYLGEKVIEHISSQLGIALSEVTGVVSFYSYFTTTEPGKNTIRVCLGTACYVRGGKQVLEDLQKQLHITVGETTADRCFSLDIGRCFGACGLAPVLMVNEDIHQRVKATKLRELIEQYTEEEPHESGE